MLTPERLQRLRDQLEKQRQEMQEDMDNLKPDMLQTDTNAGVGNHPAEDATMMYEQESFVSLQRHDRATLDRINRALHHMDEGTYGICERCGREIDFARLKAQPYATLCMDCQRIAER